MKAFLYWVTAGMLSLRVAAEGSAANSGEAGLLPEYSALTNAIVQPWKSNTRLDVETVREQLRRPSCALNLPPIHDKKLSTEKLVEQARASSFRVGWYYRCTTCEDWQLNLAAGYAITADGAIATAYHVVAPPRDLREGCLVVADDSGRAFPIIEVLAGNRYSDACIIRVKGDSFVPLALNTNVHPGDIVYCWNNPSSGANSLSQGTVKRLFRLPAHRLTNVPGAPFFAPTRIDINIDWSRGSSGAPLLDQFCNVIGHVSTISIGDQDSVSHTAASALDILGLINKEATLQNAGR